MVQVEMENWKTTGKLNIETMKLDDWMEWMGYPRDLPSSLMGSKRFAGEVKRKKYAASSGILLADDGSRPKIHLRSATASKKEHTKIFPRSPF